VIITGDTHTYSYGDRGIAFHRCSACGCHTHWLGIDPTSTSDRMALNARLLPRAVLQAGSVRHFDGLDSWTFRDAEQGFERRDIGCNIMK